MGDDLNDVYADESLGDELLEQNKDLDENEHDDDDTCPRNPWTMDVLDFRTRSDNCSTVFESYHCQCPEI